MGILAATVFGIHYNLTGIKGYTLVKFIFGFDMILPIKHSTDLGLIRQQNQTQIKYDINNKDMKILGYKYKVGDKLILRNKSAHKLKTPRKVLYEITQIWINGTVTLQVGETIKRLVIFQINPHINNIDY